MAPKTTESTLSDDNFSLGGFKRDRFNTQRETPLSISASTREDGMSWSQSSGSSSAQPHSPYRTVSDPVPYASTSTSQYATTRRSTTTDIPESQGYNNTNASFQESSRSSRSSKNPTSPSFMTDKRRESDPKSNLYTQCGRHGDQWLFGGFPFDNIKKALGSEKKG